MKKRLMTVFCLISCLAMMLTGCGSRLDDGTVDGCFSEVFNLKKDCIWYVCNADCYEYRIKEDASVLKIYVIKDGQMLVYSLFNDEWSPDMGEISKMTDKEILKKLESCKASDPITSLEYLGASRLGHRGHASENIYEVARNNDEDIEEIETEYEFKDGSQSGVFICGDAGYAGFRIYDSNYRHLVKRVKKDSKVDFRTDYFQ